MINLKIFPILFFVLVFTTCKKDYPVQNVNNNSNEDCQVMTYFMPIDTSYVPSPFTINDAAMEGDYLKLQVSYGGGCKEHYFHLAWNQFSMSPFVVINLTHNANGDLCKALITKNLCFNISKLKGSNLHGETGFPLKDSYGKTFQIRYVY